MKLFEKEQFDFSMRIAVQIGNRFLHESNHKIILYIKKINSEHTTVPAA